MLPETLPNLPEGTLTHRPLLTEEQVQAYLQKHWNRYQQLTEPSTRSPSVTTPVTAETLYAKLTSYRFCKQKPAEPEAFYHIIAQAMVQGKPIPVILGHGPLKNPNNCPESRVDWAEFFTFSQLLYLHQTLQTLYPPGISVTLFVDDARAEGANHVSSHLTTSYLESLQTFLNQSGLSRLIPQVVSLKKDLYPAYQVKTYLAQAEQTINQWEAAPEHVDALAVQLEHAIRNHPHRYDCDPQQMIQEATEAAHRYRVYHQAEILAGIWKLPNTLYGRFSGHPGFWQLFTLRKGSVSQPWQGQGCLQLNDHGKLEPFLLTQGKAAQYQQHLYNTGLSLSGFETIPVVQLV